MTFAAVLLPALLFQSGDSLESLLERLRTEDAAARREALGLLRGAMDAGQAEEGANRVLEVLERVPGPLEKGALIRTLGALGAAGAVRPLSALLADRSEKNVHLKRSCAAALAAIGRPRGIRALVDALAAEDVYVRQGATSALEGTGADLSGYDPRAGEEENRAALARVRAWGATKFGAAWDE